MPNQSDNKNPVNCPAGIDLVEYGMIREKVKTWEKQLDGNGREGVIDIVRQLDKLDIPEWKRDVDTYIMERKMVEKAVRFIITPGMALLLIDKAIHYLAWLSTNVHPH